MVKWHTAIYGNIKMKRIYCKKCRTTAFLIKGIKQCCNEPIHQEKTDIRKIITPPLQKRNMPRKKERDLILVLQHEKCLYCNKKFGTVYEHNGKILFTKLYWDHYVPFSFSFDNRKTNFVATCNICNGIKSNKMFDTLEEVKSYVEYHRKKKGYAFYEDTEKEMS